MMITGLLFSPTTPLLSPPPKVDAQGYPTIDIMLNVGSWGQWITQNIWSAAQTGFQAFDKFLNTKSFLNDYVIKPLIKAARKSLIDQIKTQTIEWINTGFKGKPLFMTDPSQLAKNMATEQLTLVKKQVLDGVGGVANQLRYANKEIAKSLVIEARSSKTALSKALTPTKDKVIAESLCSDADQIKTLAKRSGQTEAQVRTIYCGTENSKEKYDALTNCFAYDFNCGGWGAFLSLTQNPVNDDQQRLAVAKNSLESSKATEQKNTETELTANGGFFNMKTCAERSEPTEAQKENGDPGICIKYISQTPGTAVRDSLTQVVQDPISQLQLDDDISSALTEIAAAFISSVMTKGLTAINGAVADASAMTEACINERQTEISNAINGVNSTQTTKSKCADGKSRVDLKDGIDWKTIATAIKNKPTTSKDILDAEKFANNSVASIKLESDGASQAAKKDKELELMQSKLDGTCQGAWQGGVIAPEHAERIAARNKSLKIYGYPITGDDAVDNLPLGGGGVDGGIYFEGAFGFETDASCKIIKGEFIIYGIEIPTGSVNPDGSYNAIFDGLEVNMKTDGTRIFGIVNEYGYPHARGYMEGVFTPMGKI